MAALVNERAVEDNERVDQIDALNPISLLKKPQEFQEAFQRMTTIAFESFKKAENDKAIKALVKALDMMDLGKNILKTVSKYWKAVLFANLARGYQLTRKLQKCHKFSERLTEELTKLLEIVPTNDHFLKMSRILITTKFQHCAILSQLEQHEKALDLCKSTIPVLQKYIQVLLKYTEESSLSSIQEKKNGETVQFSKHVYRFSEDILNELSRSLKEPLKPRDKTSFYYWEKNPEQNQEQVKKKYIPNATNNCKRSILGVNKNNHWIDEFNIGSIMHMSETNIQDLESTLPIEEYLFKDKLYELVIFCSLTHFMIATELRFIQSSKQKEIEAPGQNSDKHQQKLEQINKKYGYEHRSELFDLSELYHLRSVQIMAKNIKLSVPYLIHIIKSYDKHYLKKKKVLEPIAAIMEESVMTAINDSLAEYEDKGSDQSEYHEKLIAPDEGLLLESMNKRYQDEDCGSSIKVPVKKMRGSRDNIDYQNGSEEYLKSKRQNKSGCKTGRSTIRSRPNKMKSKPKNQTGFGTKKKFEKIKDKRMHTDYDGEKEFRIKHESTTHIKVLYKKKK